MLSLSKVSSQTTH